jgi:uncharacterized protein YjbJ (UPF0337 family)
LADTTENKIDQAVAKTAGGTASAAGNSAGAGQGEVKVHRDDAAGSANQSTATLKDKIFGAVKKVTGGA